MATIKHSGLISDIRGSIDNMVFSIQKAGIATVRSKSTVVRNPASPDQAALRCSIANLSKAWRAGLDAVQRALWATWALTKPGMGNKDGGIMSVIKGNGGIMSGFCAYIMANQWLVSAGLATTEDAPLGLTPPSAPNGIGFHWDAPGLRITWNAPETKKTGAVCRVWVASHQPAIHKQLVGYALATTETLTIANFKGANGEDVAVEDAPGDYIFQMDTVDIDGTKSGPSVAVEGTIPAA